MPTYVYRCPVCGGEEVLTRKVDDRNLPVRCMDCGTDMPRQISAPRVNMDGQEATKQ